MEYIFPILIGVLILVPAMVLTVVAIIGADRTAQILRWVIAGMIGMLFAGNSILWLFGSQVLEQGYDRQQIGQLAAITGYYNLILAISVFLFMGLYASWRQKGQTATAGASIGSEIHPDAESEVDDNSLRSNLLTASPAV